MKRITGAVDTKTQINKRDKMKRHAVYGDNFLTVTGTISTLFDQDAAETFVLADYFLLAFRIKGTKGGTAGKVEWVIDNTGTATITFNTDSTSAKIYEYVQASAAYEASFTLGCHVSGAGTLKLRAQGTSVGSNLTTVSIHADSVY